MRSSRGLEAAIAAVARAVAQAVVAGELQKFRLEQGESRSKQMELASCPPGRLVEVSLTRRGGERVLGYLLYLSTCRRHRRDDTRKKCTLLLVRCNIGRYPGLLAAR